MPLTDEDLDRLGDKLKISVRDALDGHVAGYHVPLEKRVGKLESAQGFLKGAAWLCGVLFALALALIERGK